MVCEFCLCLFYLLSFNLSITYHLYHLSLLFINHISWLLPVNHLSCPSFFTYLLSIYTICLSTVLHLSLVTITVMLVPSTGTCSMDHALKWSLDQLTQLYNCFSSVHLSQSIIASLQSKTDHGIQAHAIASPSHSVLGGKHLHLTTRPCAIWSWWLQSQSPLSFALFQHFSFLSDHLKTSAYC